MNPEDASQQLGLILPYINHLKDVINKDLRAMRRKESIDARVFDGPFEQTPTGTEVDLFVSHKPATREEQLCYPGEPLSQHPTDEDRLKIIRRELADEKTRAAIRRADETCARFDMNGNVIPRGKI
jgi:hypothetical protein